jgi:hypothetical protein
MQRATLLLENGQKQQVYLLDEQDLKNAKQFGQKNWREHLYLGYLVIGSIAFALGIAISLKRLNGNK